jgi:iron complex outermembrane recepter protein
MIGSRTRRYGWAVVAAFGVAAARAQPRAGDNAVTEAEDAFGTSIGRETIGLYDTGNVRGFSPIDAGNVRIDGLYFDQVWGLSTRLRRTATVRVGLSALGYPFPAPTGIVDYALRVPGDDPGVTLFVNTSDWGEWLTEVDGVVPLADGRVGLGLGATLWETENRDGTDGHYRNAGATLRLSPTEKLEIVPYWQRSKGTDDETGPIYVPIDGTLPPRIERRHFDGPEWLDYEGVAANYGTVLRYAPNETWLLRAGAFRSLYDDDSVYANLLVDLEPDGSARRVLIADPSPRVESTSGEIRLTRSIVADATLHVVHVSARARERTRVYDGSAVVNLGTTQLGEPVTAPQPDFLFGEPTHDLVRQQTLGVAYEARRRGLGEIGVGLQRTDYDKRVAEPGLEPATTAADPWLYNVTLAATPSERFAIYLGYTRGLEESGVAPDSATNRNEALSAIRTRQADAGVRFALTPELQLVAGVFDVRKPYLGLDATGLYRELGEQQHRGVETSLAGSLGARFDIVAGAVFQRPRVRGEAVALGEIGETPIEQPERTLKANVEWRPAALEAFSFDAGVTHTGAVPATTDNRVELPSRTLVDLGGRYRFVAGRAPAVLRVAITNVFDEYGYDVRGSGAYDVISGRLVTVYVTIDW